MRKSCSGSGFTPGACTNKLKNTNKYYCKLGSTTKILLLVPHLSFCLKYGISRNATEYNKRHNESESYFVKVTFLRCLVTVATRYFHHHRNGSAVHPEFFFLAFKGWTVAKGARERELLWVLGHYNSKVSLAHSCHSCLNEAASHVIGTQPAPSHPASVSTQIHTSYSISYP